MAEQDTDDAPTGGRRKLLIIGVVAVLLLAGGGVAALQLLGGGDEEPEWAKASEAVDDGPVLDVATLTSNVAGDANLARVGLAVVTSVDAVEDQVVARFPLIKDAAVTELASTPAEELRTAEGADRLRRRLTKRTKQIYPDGEVQRVLLTELVVQ